MHTVSCEPGAAPEPLHVGQASVTGTTTGTFPPRAATRNGMVTMVSTLSPLPRPVRLSPPPKIEENRSPIPPNPPKSLRSRSSKGERPEAPGGVRVVPGRDPVPMPANAPYLRRRSYCLRFSASESTE
ncbi:MAG: hypothetical protein A2083_06620 [Gemmatimonadetes bacterium GWC2_71_9]|nr:MAG: hypothetical protein A2083_06620 [Gemmatimonadetes bacterium GWC2_71_9]